LVDWYKSFKKAYHGLFIELQRRVHVETTIKQKTEEYRIKLKEKFENEIKERNKFNTKAIKYLPPAFHGLLIVNPIKHEILPTENVSMLRGLKEDDELFAGMEFEAESASTISSYSTSLPSVKDHVKKRTTTL